MIEFFTNPSLRPSTLGCMLIGFSSAIIGVLTYLKRRSLIGETLSHATFPGIILSALCAAFFSLEESAPWVTLIGAALFAGLGLKALNHLESHLRIKSDAALCFVLASFFGLGVLLASGLQTLYPLWIRQAMAFLYGQAATMTNEHVMIYAAFALLTLLFFTIFYRYIEAVHFDPLFAKPLRSRRKKSILFMCSPSFWPLSWGFGRPVSF